MSIIIHKEGEICRNAKSEKVFLKGIMKKSGSKGNISTKGGAYCQNLR